MLRLLAACLAMLVAPLGFAGLGAACSARPEPPAPVAAPPAAAGPAGTKVDPARSSPASTPFLDSLTVEERAWLSAHPVIRVVQDPGWPPIEFSDEQGNPSGMTRDYLDLIERRLGLTFEQVRGLSWQEGYSRLRRWEIDMTTTVAVTPEREAFWSFTAPYMTIPIVIATRADVTYIATMKELSGKQVAVVDGYAVTYWLPRDFPEIELVRVKTSQEGLERLQRGEVFAFIDSLLTIGYQQAKFKTVNVKIAGHTPYTNSQCMAVRKDWAPLAGILQKALESISETERNEILRRWMPLRYEQGFDYALFAKVLAPLTLLLLGFVVWNRKLASEIRQRKSAEAQRGRAEEALSASEARFRRYVEAAPQALFVVDGRGRCVDFNPAALELVGVDAPTLRSTALTSLLAEASREAALRDFDVLVSTGRLEGEYRLLRPDGRSAWVILRGVRIGDDRFMAFCQDITGRKQVEAEHEQLTMAIEQASEVVMVTDAGGAIQYVNPAFEKVTGYSRAEAQGRNARMLKSGEHGQAFYRALWETISGGSTWRGRLVNRKKLGSTYTEDASISPVRDAAGAITAYVAVKRDVSRVLDLEAQFLQSQKMEGIGRLAGGIAHDFNNILAVILSSASLVLERMRGDDPLREDLLEIERGGQRAATLTRQLLAFSRKQILQPIQLDLNKVLAGMEKMLHRVIGEDIEFHKVLSPDLGMVKADPGQVEQVILNLIVNARDAMPKGGQLTIETRNADVDTDFAAQRDGMTPGPHVMLSLTDSGIGMDEPTMARIFEPFFTTKGVDQGSGLGLSTVYGIVKQSGGSIFVYSHPGVGSTFKMYLPREAPLTAPVVTAPPAETCPAGTETVLVVEDDPSVRHIARRILEGAGYTDDAIVHHGVLDAGTAFIGKPFTKGELLRKVRGVLDGVPALAR